MNSKPVSNFFKTFILYFGCFFFTLVAAATRIERYKMDRKWKTMSSTFTFNRAHLCLHSNKRDVKCVHACVVLLRSTISAEQLNARMWLMLNCISISIPLWKEPARCSRFLVTPTYEPQKGFFQFTHILLCLSDRHVFIEIQIQSRSKKMFVWWSLVHSLIDW